MPMTREQAYEIEQTMKKLLAMFKATADINQQQRIQAQMDRLDPYLDEAGAIVIRTTDTDFAGIAADVANKTKPLTDAVADISRMSAGIATAAAIINALIAVLGAAAKI